MTKYEQKCANLNATMHYEAFKDALRMATTSQQNYQPLRSCSAKTFDLVDDTTGVVLYHVLRSYDTIVAFVDPRTNTLYDVLRLVYGYTATSAQHISKFHCDCCPSATIVTYKEV
jgi:hypothetical protein